MSAALVLYTLNANGNLKGELGEMSSEMTALKARATELQAKVDDLSSSTRGSASAVSLGRQALSGFADEAGKVAQGVGGVAAGIGILGYGVNALLSSNDAWEQSTARLTNELGLLQAKVADAIGPTAGQFLDNFTIGLAAVSTFLLDMVTPAMSAFGSVVDAVLDGLGEWIRLADRLVHLDFAGAVDTIKSTQARQVADATAAAKALSDGFTAAMADAGDSAYAAWKKATDGISDTATVKAPRVVAATPTKAATYDGGFASPEAGLGLLGPVLLPLEKALVTLSTDLPDALKDLATKVEQGLAAAKTNAQVTGATSILGAVGSGDLGSVVGQVVGMAAGGPIGALVGAIVSIGPQIDEIVASLFHQLGDFTPGLTDALANVLGMLPDVIGTILPKVISDLTMALPVVFVAILANLIPILVAVLEGVLIRFPLELTKALVTFGKGLVTDFPRMLVDGFLHAWALVKRDFQEIANVFGRGGVLDTHLGANAEEKRILGVKIPSFDRFQDSMGTITRSGLAMVHAGERIGGGGGGGTTIGAIHVHGVQDARRFAEEVRRYLGSYGLGLTLEPRG